MGRDLFDALGISVTQTKKLIEGIMINNIDTQCPFEFRMAKQIPNLNLSIGRSKVHILKSNFHKRLQPKHQKSRRVPINLQETVNTEIS